MTGQKSKDAREFGDFQTPPELARRVTQLLRELGIMPNCVLEPTCGYGSFLAAAAVAFPEAERLIGFDINQSYVSEASRRLEQVPGSERINISQGDFFQVDWKVVLGSVGAKNTRWLLLGNPPWVTNAELGLLRSRNLPEKSNFHGHSGIEARTGKSNFDISEWMLLRYLEWLSGREGAIAVLCKTAVARRILAYVWKERYPVHTARIFTIDAKKYFNVAVDASLFVLEVSLGSSSLECDVFTNLELIGPAYKIGYYDGLLVADVARFHRWGHLRGVETGYTWRSGIKHDCSKVMEVFADKNGLWNRLGEQVEIEDTFLFPLLKGSDIGNRSIKARGFMLVTQRTTGEDTRAIQIVAPKTWNYLQSHAPLLNERASSIYRNRPPFSIFGVGEYSFAPWKVAVSALYKNLNFVKVGPVGKRPAVFDDTVCFLPCNSEAEANFLCTILNSTPAQEFYRSMVFWSDKRPITIDLLKRLSLRELAHELGQVDTYMAYMQTPNTNSHNPDVIQARLF